MDRADRQTGAAPDSHTRLTGEVDVPVARCSATGELRSMSPAALGLLRRLGVHEHAPQLPELVWQALEHADPGQAVALEPSDGAGGMLECTRYGLACGGFLLWLRELPEHAPLGLHEERRRATGRLLASVAHDVRSSVASIVYSADFLDASGAAMQQSTLQETVRDICDASRRLQLTVDGLLDYARLGPAISVPVSLQETLHRAHGLLRSFHRTGAHRLHVELAQGAEWVRGNPVVIEQIFVNLLLNAAEHVDTVGMVTVRASVGPLPTGLVQIELMAGKPTRHEPHGPAAARPRVRTEARLALLDAGAAAESQGGQLSSTPGSALSFTVLLPRSEGPR